MIIAHKDSNGEPWYFHIDAPRNSVAVVARKLSRSAARVRAARVLPHRTNVELSRAMLAEAVALADLQAYNGTTAEEYERTPQDQRIKI